MPISIKLPLLILMARIIFVITLTLTVARVECLGQAPKSEQTVIINGKIVSEDGPIQYAAVYLPNTTFGTVSNESGDFLLKFPSSYDTKENHIIISSIGFESLTIGIDSLKALETVRLRESVSMKF